MFTKTVPYDDELDLAKKIYQPELEASGIYQKIAQEAVQEHDARGKEKGLILA